MNQFLITFKRWFLLGCLIFGLCAFFYFDLQHYLNFSTLKSYQISAQQWTVLHYKMAVVIYILFFTLLIACTIPCATVLTLIGGFLFGVSALFYAVFATTLGGTILFFAVRTSLAETIRARSSGWIKRMEVNFQKNAFNYILLFRLMPIFPCWVSNVSAGALNVPLRIFIAATVLGIFPSTLIYVLVGRGLDKLFAQNQIPNIHLLLTPSILFPLLGLAFLSIFPVIYRGIKKNPGVK